jgi:hypothetical protein
MQDLHQRSVGEWLEGDVDLLGGQEWPPLLDAESLARRRRERIGNEAEQA